MMMKKKRIILFLFLLIVLTAPFTINRYVTLSTTQRILPQEEVTGFQADCILVLGAGITPDGRPSYMLRDRLDKGIELYEAGAAPKLLLSGDNGQERYDEVNAMKQYVLEHGIPKEDVFLDHAGFSTYESVYRAKAIFQVERAIIVTQKYHLYRALFIAKQLGLETIGISTLERRYAGQWGRDVREFLARNKDFFQTLYKPEPTFLGEVIPISGDGRLSHD
ncbi:protein SanA, affects membrane permeability for vancomycin [Acidaminobacter hydrogenoformans DSM 2784]|uniref:Protein SanA, affects membrane permeability for vancomycin n=2 Tax=Acidaminobacter TaxID=65402 RepID=A0A1G5RVN2_9FIRM|nr:protein SanA, affects membrane permeability for vancomycin [Acidaminobacter hydrogenoformans DSM 2784]